MLNVLYVTPIPTPFQIELVEYCNSISGKGHISLIFLNESTQSRSHWNAKETGLTLPRNKLRSFYMILKEKKPDLVIFGKYRSSLVLILIYRKLRYGSKFVLGPFEILQPTNKLVMTLKRFLFRLLAFYSDGVLAVGKTAVEFYESLYDGSIVNIPYTFNLSELIAKKRVIKIDDGSLTFLFSGRLEAFRNPLGAIKSINTISGLYPELNLKLIISGQGSLYQECLDLITSFDLERKIIWKNDFENWYDIHNIYFDADILLAVQNYSGWGIIIQEAMAARMGIIASKRMMSAKDLIENDVNGFLINPNNENEILEAMKRYIDDPKLISDHGLKNKSLIKEMDVSVIAKRLNDFIRNL